MVDLRYHVCFRSDTVISSFSVDSAQSARTVYLLPLQSLSLQQTSRLSRTQALHSRQLNETLYRETESYFAEKVDGDGEMLGKGFGRVVADEESNDLASFTLVFLAMKTLFSLSMFKIFKRRPYRN